MESVQRNKVARLYRCIFGTELPSVAPQTLSQKLWHMRICPSDPLIDVLADGDNQRELLRARQFERKLRRSYGIYTSALKVPWNSLPERFVLSAQHIPCCEVTIDTSAHHWKSKAYRAFLRLCRDTAWQQVPFGKKSEKKLLRREYVHLPGSVQIFASRPERLLHAVCIGGTVQLLYWEDAPECLYSASGTSLIGHDPLVLYLQPQPGALSLLTVFCEGLSEGFAFMHIIVQVGETDFLFHGLRFYEDERFLRSLPPSLDRELGSLLPDPLNR